MPALPRVAPALVRSLLRFATRSDATAAESLALPTRRSERALAAVAHRGFQVSVLVSAALVLGLLAFNTRAMWFDSVKFALGTTMAGEGFLLAADWHGARRLTLSRLRRQRVNAHETQQSVPARLAWKLASAALQLLGLIWLAAGMLTAILGLQGLI